jgi:hypothetical protein
LLTVITSSYLFQTTTKYQDNFSLSFVPLAQLCSHHVETVCSLHAFRRRCARGEEGGGGVVGTTVVALMEVVVDQEEGL